jgi:hypothetical protein
MKMGRRYRVCRHCREHYPNRVGRGLCLTCWSNPTIRDMYAPLAPFAGGAAASIFATIKADDRTTLNAIADIPIAK